jgi:hypothetical protein
VVAPAEAQDHTSAVLVPSADAFAALARSSPWRWSTLRFTDSRSLPGARDAVRAWLRRPDELRVETVDGALVQIVHERRQEVGVLTLDGGRHQYLPWPGDDGAPTPDLRPDGLVAARPSTSELSYDAPMYQDYFWVAMLDPVELADGRDQETGDVAGPALLVDDVVEVDHFGRVAWEAVVRPTDAYEPRCGCCSLLRTRRIDLLEWGSQPGGVLAEYPEAFRVRLDVGTGVCVRTEQIGGLTPGGGHEVRIEAVDEPMGDELFPAQRWWGRR